MALSKQKKHEVVDEVEQLLKDSKLTVVAEYQGTTVKAIQQLRRDARGNGTRVTVVKNRLVKKALEHAGKSVDTSALKGQLLYAFNSEDEVAPAQILNSFARTNPSIVFVGAITADDTFMSAEEVKALAVLPSKTQLIAGVLSTLQSPTHKVMGGLKGNLLGLLDAVAAKKG
jgi:large subunit ribosomal protein L10